MGSHITKRVKPSKILNLDNFIPEQCDIPLITVENYYHPTEHKIIPLSQP